MTDAPASIFHSDLPLESKLDRARTELLDLSARNRLLNIPRFSKAAKTVEVVDEKAGEVFRMLVREGKTFTFAPGQEEKVDGGTLRTDDEDDLAELPQPSEDEGVDDRGIASRHGDTRLQTRMTSKGLQKRLLDLYQDARTLEEEQGVNILYLALGILKWVDPVNAATVRHAPLVLLPVRLERGTAGERFKLRWRQDDQSPNLSLEAYLDRVHALRLPEFEGGDDFEPPAYMAAVAEAVSTKAGWEVLPDDIVLGFFSFAKFLMYRDLDADTWPAQARLTMQPLIRSLLSDGFAPRDELVPEGARIDDYIAPADMLHIVDCDSSQTLAVHDVRSGRDLVIQGPPGTGKSQTIANIIASAVADGKTVLFVAEKMAALEVVKRRLDQAGVGDACLELHSSKSNKRLVLEELKRTRTLGSPRGDFPDSLARRLTDARNRLNAHADRMHEPHPDAQLTSYQVFGQLGRLRNAGQRPVDFELAGAERWSPEDKRQRHALLVELADRVREIGRPDDHPWSGVGLDSIVPTATERLMARVAELAAGIAIWHPKAAAFAEALETAAPCALSDAPPLVALARSVASAPDIDPAALADPTWGNRVEEIIGLLATGREFERLTSGLAGSVRAQTFDCDVEDLILELAQLPLSFGENGFAWLQTLNLLLPRLLVEADRLATDLGMSGPEHTLASISRMVVTGERVAAAPDASPEAFAATVWDHGVEQAGDLADAVATIERVRGEIGSRVTEAAWTTDVASARQALATHTGLLRRLNADWRRGNALIRTVLRTPGAPLSDVLTCLDALIQGQTSSRAIKEGDAFGQVAFGSDWRGDRSASAPLAALVAWMRTLRGLGAEPRMIAGRIPQRSVIADRTEDLKRLVEDARPMLSSFWSELREAVPAVFGNAPAVERAALAAVAVRIAAVSDADARSRAAMSGVPPLSERIDRLRRIVARQKAAGAIAEGEELGSAAFGRAWSGIRSDWITLAQAVHWIIANESIRHLASRVKDRDRLLTGSGELEAGQHEIARDLEALLQELQANAPTLFGSTAAHTALDRIASRLAMWLANAELLSKWVAYRARAERGQVLGLQVFVERLQDGRLNPVEAIPVFEMAYFEALLTDLVRRDPELGRFDGILHGNVAQEFASLDKQRIAAASLEVVRAHHRRIPQPSGVGPVGVLRGEMARRRGHMPIRQLMQRAAPAVQALKPVLMMSPLSVAQFLTPGVMTFDLLVMDEASQIQPVDALGAIARCKQVVVVGDERQLPPTRFFSKMTSGQGEEDDEDGAGVSDIESILGLFTARGLPQRMLRWHYRSRHQSLIAVSNSQFYENKLFIVPSPYTQEAGMGLLFRHVPDGVFDSGGTGTNPIEARLVAEEVIRHAKTEPERSLGVATFSSKQRRAIQDELEVLRRLNPDTEEFFHGHPNEPFFVKNLENVQGDERDAIMISVGYGRNAQGYMAMRFGPLGADGGERRLNVLISRAKRRCEVFSSITDDDIDLERAKGKGVFAFKLFLHYARTGRLLMAQATGREPDSVFEEQVAKALQERGYQVHPQVGIAGFFIDLAIADQQRPGRYVLGIECDGASYHSSRSARDRDRLRQAVLEDHGWIIHRIWSTDWFQRPQEQLDRVIAAIEAAKVQLDERLEGQQQARRAVPIEVVTVERADVTEIGLAEVVENRQRAYEEASPQVPLEREMHEVPSGLMAGFIEQVVAVEGPIHVDEVVVRLRSAWGLQRAGGRIQAAVERGVEVAVQRFRILRDGAFLSLPGQEARVRDRSGVSSSSLRKPEMLPPAETEATVLQVVTTSLGASVEEVVLSGSRLLGFKATSALLRQLIQHSVDALLAKGTLTIQGKLLVAAPEQAGSP